MCRFQNGKVVNEDKYIYCPAGEILTAVHVVCEIATNTYLLCHTALFKK